MRFLFKTEPSTYSFADLQRDKSTVWDGVSNAAALLHLGKIRTGDSVIIYHSGSEKQAVGLAVAVTDAYPDPKTGNPKRPVVQIVADRALPRPVSLSEARADQVLVGSELVRFSRLSIMPFTEPQFQRLLQLARAR